MLRVLVVIRLQTDGDFSLLNSDDFGIKLIGEHGFGYKLIEVPEHDFHPQLNETLTGYFEEMLTSFRVISTHYFVLKYLYDMFGAAIQYCGTLHEPEHEPIFYSSLSGNYEGTYICMYVVPEEHVGHIEEIVEEIEHIYHPE